MTKRHNFCGIVASLFSYIVMKLFNLGGSSKASGTDLHFHSLPGLYIEYLLFQKIRHKTTLGMSH